MTKGIVIFLTISCLSCQLLAQKQDSVHEKKNFLERMDSITNWKVSRGRSTFMPFVAPSYTPETSVMLTLGGLFTFMTKPGNKVLSRSSIPFSIGLQTANNFITPMAQDQISETIPSRNPPRAD